MVYDEVREGKLDRYEIDLAGVPTSLVGSFVHEGMAVNCAPFYCYNCDLSFLDWPEAKAHLQDSCTCDESIVIQGGECPFCGTRF